MKKKKSEAKVATEVTLHPKMAQPKPPQQKTEFYVKKAKIDTIGEDQYQLTLIDVNPTKGLNLRESKVLSLKDALAGAEAFLTQVKE